MIVKIRQGFLEGREDVSITTGKVFYSFSNIPYGEPPVGELRFQPPIPAAGWIGIRDATLEGNRCLQILKEYHLLNESEDCLYLNVYIPKIPNRKDGLLPVMVYIHGGGYYFSDANMETAAPDNLINYDVIIVTVNYRLHIFGFLNVNTPSSRGNCGSKDQVLALRWVQENIEFFGGDPKNVTIFGDSSGGNAVHLLTISPLAAGLFHKAIAGSGTIISAWTRHDQVDEAFKIGRRLGFSGSDPEKLVKFLKLQPAFILAREARLLINAQKHNTPLAMNATMIFVPSIEKYSYGAFLPDYPINLISQSQPVPILAGVTEKEGITVLFGLNSYKHVLGQLNENLLDLVRLNVPCDQSDLMIITEKIKDHYLASLGPNPTNDERAEKFIEIFSHLYFMYFYDIIEKTTKSSAPSYVFMFSFVGQLNESLHWDMPVSGALHADYSEYIMLSRCLHRNGVQLQDSTREVMNNLCVAWANFARNSNPNPLPNTSMEWKSFKPNDPSYMLFDQRCKSMRGKIWEEGLEFWKQIFQQYVNWNDHKNQKWKL